MGTASESFEKLLTIMDELREKCPWDQKQTIQTLRQQTIEELYELTDAITDEDWNSIREELGDLLLHIVFYARIGLEQGQLSMVEVINGICQKLISRHPHIYGNTILNTEQEVKQNWEKLKLKEGKDSVLAGVPRSLPALVKAMRLQEKSRQVGFEWEETRQVREKVEEELKELEEAVLSQDSAHIQEEFGDLLFSLVNYSRFLNLDAENALELTNIKFIRRFSLMEKKAAALGKSLPEMSLAEMDSLWNETKANEHGKL